MTSLGHVLLDVLLLVLVDHLSLGLLLLGDGACVLLARVLGHAVRRGLAVGLVQLLVGLGDLLARLVLGLGVHLGVLAFLRQDGRAARVVLRGARVGGGGVGLHVVGGGLCRGDAAAQG